MHSGIFKTTGTEYNVLLGDFNIRLHLNPLTTDSKFPLVMASLTLTEKIPEQRRYTYWDKAVYTGATQELVVSVKTRV